MIRQTAFVAASLLLFSACAAQDEAVDGGETVDVLGKEDRGTVHPAGRYAYDDNGSSFAYGDFTELTLNADGSYGGHVFTYCAAASLVDCGRRHGSYKLTHRAGNTYLRFYDADGNFVARYQYKLSGDALRLELTGRDDARWFSIQHIDGDTFVADAKSALLGAAADDLLDVNPEALPAAARAAYDQLAQDIPAYPPHAYRMDVDHMTVYVLQVRMPDNATSKLFDETGLIASGHTNFAGHFAWE